MTTPYPGIRAWDPIVSTSNMNVEEDATFILELEEVLQAEFYFLV